MLFQLVAQVRRHDFLQQGVHLAVGQGIGLDLDEVTVDAEEGSGRLHEVNVRSAVLHGCCKECLEVHALPFDSIARKPASRVGEPLAVRPTPCARRRCAGGKAKLGAQRSNKGALWAPPGCLVSSLPPCCLPWAPGICPCRPCCPCRPSRPCRTIRRQFDQEPPPCSPPILTKANPSRPRLC